MQYFDKKLPGEEWVLTFNMAPGLPSGVTLTGTPAVTVSTYNGTDPNPTALLNGPAQIDATATQVLVPVTGGLNQNDYLFTAFCPTTSGAILPGLEGVLPVRTLL
jgi:hypothetical protein